VLKGFRDFIMRGNIVDLAVGVVVGVAFNDLVTALTADFITPLINMIGGGGNLGGTFKVMGQVFRPGHFVGQVINFVLVAAALYFLVVLPMNKLNERRSVLTKRFGIFGRKAPEEEAVAAEPAPPLPADIALLTQIRDSLAALEDRSVLAPSQRSATQHRSAEATDTP
jgi:large conductance mechanosensitive channel